MQLYMSRMQRVLNESQSCLSLLNLFPPVNCFAVKISSFIRETLLCQKIVPSARTFVLITHVGKMHRCSCAVVHERSGSSPRKFSKWPLNTNVCNVVVPRRNFLRPWRTELVLKGICDMLCCAVTEEQPDAKTNKLMSTKLISFQACYAIKKGK